MCIVRALAGGHVSPAGADILAMIFRVQPEEKILLRIVVLVPQLLCGHRSSDILRSFRIAVLLF